MKATFVETTGFQKAIDKLKDKELIKSSIEKILMENPEAGDLIVGTGGLRKVRIATSSKGKSGGYRVIYFFHSKAGEIYLISLCPKSEQEDLSEEAKKIFRRLIEQIKKY